jgi:uncharacterized protein (DUF433 family)
MRIAETCYEHIAIDEHGVPYIAGTNMRIVELVGEKLSFGWSPEELHFQHPYLSLGQIHAALSYYWDRADALDKDMADRLQKIKNLKKKAPTSPLILKLKSQGLI